MKKIMILSVLLIPIFSYARTYPEMNVGGMQQMMQQMQNCVQNIDQSQIKTLQQRTSAIEIKVKVLCASGQRDSAQALARSFGQEIKNNSAMQTMKKCSELMKGMMPEMPGINKFQDDLNSDRHVCDSL